MPCALRAKVVIVPTKAAIIVYHFFHKGESRGCFCNVHELKRQLAFIKSRFCVLSVETLLEDLEQGKEFDKTTVALMIDDGDESIHSLGYPVFRDMAIPVHVNLSCGFIGRDDPSYPGNRGMNTVQLGHLLKDGLVTFGSHGMTHRKMDALDAQEVEFEIVESKKIIESIQGQCRTFIYPYGDARFVTRTSESCLKAAGYEYAFTTTAGLVKAGVDRFRIPRTCLRNQVSNLKLLMIGKGWHPLARAGRDWLMGKRFYGATSPGGRIGLGRGQGEQRHGR